MLNSVKEVVDILSPLLSVIVLLIVYIWTRKVLKDDKTEEKVTGLPDKFREDLKHSIEEVKANLKEWTELREIYLRTVLKEHSDDISTLYNRVTGTEKDTGRICERLDAFEKRCNERHSSFSRNS